MKKVITDENLSCRYCIFASHIDNSDDMFCEKKGIVSFGGYCKKFKFNPLSERNSHRRMLDVSDYDSDDFLIE